MAKTQTAAVSNVSPLTSAVRRHVGMDDGHYGIKLYTDDFKLFVPSRIATGSMVELAGTGDDDNCYEDAQGRTFTVSESLSFMDTRLGTYALSPENHVLIHHALMKAGLGGLDVSLSLIHI